MGNLPDSCAIGTDGSVGALIIRRDAPGFTYYRGVAFDEYNRSHSVAPNHVSAMLLGAVAGWRSVIVDPDLFDASGQLVNQVVISHTEMPDEMSLCAFWCAANGLTGSEEDDLRLPARLSIATRERIRENRQAFMAVVRFRAAFVDTLKFALATFRDHHPSISTRRFERG